MSCIPHNISPIDDNKKEDHAKEGNTQRETSQIVIKDHGELGFFGYQFYRLSALHIFIPSSLHLSSLHSKNQLECSLEHPIVVTSSNDMMHISNSVYYYGTSSTHTIPYFFKTFLSIFTVSGGQLQQSKGSIFLAVKVTDPSESHNPTLLPPNPLASQDYNWYSSVTSNIPIPWCHISTPHTTLISYESPRLSTYGFSNLSHHGKFYHDPFHYLLIEIPYTAINSKTNSTLPDTTIQLTTLTPFSNL